jgi:MSHA biogenesis protein MshN
MSSQVVASGTDGARAIAPLAAVAAAPANDTSARSASSDVAALGDASAVRKVTSPRQQSGNLVRQAVAQLQQVHPDEAQQFLRKALAVEAGNKEARQLLAESLVESGKASEAAVLLQEGLKLTPGDADFSALQARIQIASGNGEKAVASLEAGYDAGASDPEYHALYAAALQKQGRHEQAAQHYLVALRSDPTMPTWLVGVGISLQALGKYGDATAAYQRAIDTEALPANLVQFAQKQVTQMRDTASTVNSTGNP